MIEGLVTSKTKKDILVLLFSNPDREFYLREISRKIGQQPNLVRDELKKLEDFGFVQSRMVGRAIYYSPDKKGQIYREVRGIVLKGGLFVGALRKMLEGEKGKIDFAFVYGSFARGDEKKSSDIDVIIIGEPNLQKLAKAVRESEGKIGREINYSVYPKEEFLRKSSNGFISHVMRENKIMLAGSEDEFKRFVDRRQAKED